MSVPGRRNYPEQTARVKDRTCRKEKVVGLAILRSASSKSESPQAVNGDRLSLLVTKLAKKCSGIGIEGVDAAIEQVADQQVVTEGAEIGGCHSESPGPVEVTLRSEGFDEGPIGTEDVHDPAGRSAKEAGEGDVEQTIDVLNVEGREAQGRRSGISKGTGQGEAGIEHINFVASLIGGVEKILAATAAYGKSGEERAGNACSKNSIRWVHGRVPATDASILAIEDEKSGT